MQDEFNVGSQYVSMPTSPNDLYAQQINEEKIKNIISQISPSNQVEEIEMRLKGYKKDIFSGDWVPISSIKKSTISEELIARYTSWLSSFMSINTTMGNLSERQITLIMKNCVEWVVDDVDHHAEDYGMGTDLFVDMDKDGKLCRIKVGFTHDYTERTRVCDILLNSTFFVLNRSLNGIESRRFWNSLTLNESMNMSPNNQGKSDWWKFWKK